MSQTDRMTTGVVVEAERLSDLIRDAGEDDYYCPQTEIPVILNQVEIVMLIASVSDLNTKYTVTQLRNGLDAQQTVRTERELRREMRRLHEVRRPVDLDTYRNETRPMDGTPPDAA